jgi:hypothetical protein
MPIYIGLEEKKRLVLLNGGGHLVFINGGRNVVAMEKKSMAFQRADEAPYSCRRIPVGPATFTAPPATRHDGQRLFEAASRLVRCYGK